jgi:hypothetical protein
MLKLAKSIVTIQSNLALVSTSQKVAPDHVPAAGIGLDI